MRPRFIRTFLLALVLCFSFAPARESANAQSSLDVTLHYVEGVVSADKTAYDVKAYLSVFDSNENPIKDIPLESFSLAEDISTYPVRSVALAADEPISIILLLDTSGSMVGQKVKDARAAASEFVEGLSPSDRIAIITFDDEPKTRIDFTNDRAAAQDQIELIEAKAGAGTCLYDAIYDATEMMVSIPSGRRSIVVLTDGVDERKNNRDLPCSIHTIDDVIDFASAGTLRVPIYSIGLGNLPSEESLTRMAINTGGRYLYSRDSEQLRALFQRLTDQLRSQYVLTYQSTGTSGEHVLAVQVSHQQALGRDTRKFLLPGLPLRLSFLAPANGVTLDGPVNLVVAASGQGDPIARVAFKAGEAVLGSDATAPYELQVDASAFAPGGLILSAAALGADGTVLAEAAITVYIPPPPTPTPTPTPTAIPVPTAPPPDGTGDSLLMIVVISFALLFVALVALLVMRRRQDKQDETMHRTRRFDERPEATLDQLDADEDALAVLTVLQSDELSTGARKYNVLKSPSQLGRSRDNDIAFPGESPVSRQHAIIEKRADGELYVKEIVAQDDEGNSKPPRFGTFVNESKVGESGMRLRAGDKLRLGKRLTLLVTIPKKASETPTSDEIALTDPDRTNDAANFDPDRTNDAGDIDVTNSVKPDDNK